jgi:hypothetical protein
LGLAHFFAHAWRLYSQTRQALEMIDALSLTERELAGKLKALVLEFRRQERDGE